MKRDERVRGLIRAPLLLWRLIAAGRYDFTYDQMPLSVRGMSWRKRANLARAGLNLLWRRSKPWSLPLHMQFELANYCQLRCPVCPTGSGELRRPKQAMDPELFAGVMSEVGPYLLTATLWGWGESLLNPRLGEILSIAARYPVVTFLSTNGQNLDQEHVLQAIFSAPPTYLIVAIDGLDDRTHSEFRKGARLEPALEGVRRIADFKKARGLRFPVLHMRFIIMRHNEHQIPEVGRFARRHGFDMVTLRRLSIVDSDGAAEIAARLRPERQQHAATPRDFTCMQPFWFPSLYADGTMVLCEQDFNAVAGCGKAGPESSFSTLWFGTEAEKHRYKIIAGPGGLPFCARCPICERGSTDASFQAQFIYPQLANPLVIGS